MIFYLRDHPKPTRQPIIRRAVESKGNTKGRPVVCIAAAMVDGPDSDTDTGTGDFWLHFCVAACSPLDLENSSVTPPFTKWMGREIALSRLKKRRTLVQRTSSSPWAESKTYTNQVGLTIPILASEGKAVQRIILGYIADGSNQFAPTARKLAEQWLTEESTD